MTSFGRRGPSLPDELVPPNRLLTFEQATARVVATLQDQLPLGLWAVARRDGDQQVFVETASPAAGVAGRATFDVTTGTVVGWHGSMCRRMVDGAPRVTADATTVPEYAGTAAVREWPVRTYLASPITTPDGRLYGTLCGYGAEVGDIAALERVAPVVDLLAVLLGQVLLSEELRAQAAAREAELYRIAAHDDLTGLATRAVLHDRLAHALDLHRARRQSVAAAGAGADRSVAGRPLTLLLIDVDDFKTVNDTHGHGAGDALLVHLADSWSHQVLAGNTLARIGGDEFALLVETGLGLDDVVTAITRGAAVPITVPGTTMRVTTSVGVAHLEPGDPTPTATELLARADRALYATKRHGKAGHTVAGPLADLVVEHAG